MSGAMTKQQGLTEADVRRAMKTLESMDPGEDFDAGRWLSKQLEERSMRQSDLARRSGVDPGVISKIISGERPNPGIRIFFRLLAALGWIHTLSMPTEDQMKKTTVPVVAYVTRGGVVVGHGEGADGLDKWPQSGDRAVWSLGILPPEGMRAVIIDTTEFDPYLPMGASLLFNANAFWSRPMLSTWTLCIVQSEDGEDGTVYAPMLAYLKGPVSGDGEMQVRPIAAAERPQKRTMVKRAYPVEWAHVLIDPDQLGFL